MTMTTEQREKVDRWYEQHGDYPRLVLGYRRRDPVRHRPGVFCLDHGDDGTPILTEDEEGEAAACGECGRHLRGAERFGEVSQVDV